MVSKEWVKELFEDNVIVTDNFILVEKNSDNNETNQKQTQDIFSDKWLETDEYKNIDKLYEFQYQWFLSLYGFESEEKLTEYLSTKKTIIDTGCGLCIFYKSITKRIGG